mmetsp:Transcript_14334/g.28589  ORF Transcript_14334/g.28589 Transcript_14334/m.28589 type:complete len:117 (+) Transcript_14334:1139-1489(+)
MPPWTRTNVHSGAPSSSSCALHNPLPPPPTHTHTCTRTHSHTSLALSSLVLLVISCQLSPLHLTLGFTSRMEMPPPVQIFQGVANAQLQTVQAKLPQPPPPPNQGGDDGGEGLGEL